MVLVKDTLLREVSQEGCATNKYPSPSKNDSQAKKTGGANEMGAVSVGIGRQVSRYWQLSELVLGRDRRPCIIRFDHDRGGLCLDV
jgi:hypothetical protein